MKGYRTMILNGAFVALPVIDYLSSNGAVVGALLGPAGATALSLLGLANLVLRWVTTTPVFQGD